MTSEADFISIPDLWSVSNDVHVLRCGGDSVPLHAECSVVALVNAFV